jgi:prepilin-type N-terminal cleavage/methylation domain-containing protein
MFTRNPSSRRSAVRRVHRRGFTLIEAAMVTVIVGVGTLGMLQLLASGTVANTRAYQTTSAINLCNNIRELTQTVPFEEVVKMDYQTFSPPIDARKQPIAAFANPDGRSPWKQEIRVLKVDENCIPVAVSNTSDSKVARVIAHVWYEDQEVCSLNWLVVKTD